ncbi:MAG: Gfo/Idh/MocA family oxidoreductase [Chloroflexi bacterium]|nr:MAG: Gfo/Idh/MocA family oxidoreductase [Chloroflexota bacterium]
MTSLKIGLIGCGFIGRFHSIAIRYLIKQRLIDARYMAVCDFEGERARSFAEITGAELVTSNPRELIESPDVDIVYICVPTAGHKDLVLQAAEQGKHIFCEKPLATNLADVEEMMAAVEAAGLKAGVGLILRHSPILTVLKLLTEDATIGRLMTAVFRDDQFFPIQGHYASIWRKDRALSGSGTLLEHSIHDVDVLRWFGGHVATVTGSIDNFAGHEGVEDLATAHIEFISGGCAELVSIWHNVLRRPSSRRLELFFENALFHIENDFMGPIGYQKHDEEPIVLTEEDVTARYLELIGLPEDRFSGALRYSLEDYFFLNNIARGEDPIPDFRLALEAHRVVDAIYRSAHAAGETMTVG